jgi:hypothetical protein
MAWNRFYFRLNIVVQIRWTGFGISWLSFRSPRKSKAVTSSPSLNFASYKCHHSYNDRISKFEILQREGTPAAISRWIWMHQVLMKETYLPLKLQVIDKYEEGTLYLYWAWLGVLGIWMWPSDHTRLACQRLEFGVHSALWGQLSSRTSRVVDKM